MTIDRTSYALLAHLLRYPGVGFHGDSEGWCAELLASCPSAGEALLPFREHVAASTPEALEELYCRTFDNSQSAALEIGWHLHGESYDRGAHLVRMRELLREHGLDEGGELPDHLANVLQVMSACSPDLSLRLAEEMVEPSVKKICVSLASGQNPYEAVLDAVLAVTNLHVQESMAV